MLEFFRTMSLPISEKKLTPTLRRTSSIFGVAPNQALADAENT
jgi:hypothetical protein